MSLFTSLQHRRTPSYRLRREVVCSLPSSSQGYHTVRREASQRLPYSNFIAADQAAYTTPQTRPPLRRTSPNQLPNLKTAIHNTTPSTQLFPPLILLPLFLSRSPLPAPLSSSLLPSLELHCAFRSSCSISTMIHHTLPEIRIIRPRLAILKAPIANHHRPLTTILQALKWFARRWIRETAKGSTAQRTK